MTTGVRRRDKVLQTFADTCGASVSRTWDRKSIPAVVGFLEGASRIQIEARSLGIPFIFFDHGYFHRDMWLSWFRVCVNNYHCTDWRESDRWIPDVEPWSRGDHILVLPSHRTVLEVYGPPSWMDDTVQSLIKRTARRVVVKNKSDGALSDFLKNAHAIVAFGSVAEVEAAIAGVPVFTVLGPASPIAQHDFSLIETPIYPDRTAWLHSLAGSEWRLDEMDLAWERIKPLVAERLLC